MNNAAAPQDALVIFTPSGKRGRVPVGTPVLQAARTLGVDLDSVCGGRGICSKCQVEPQTGSFPKHGVTVGTDALSPVNEVEARYDRIRGLAPGRRLGCQAKIMADAVIDVPPESQLHKQVIRKSATERAMVMDPAVRLHLVTVPEPTLDDPTGDFQRLSDALQEQWQISGLHADLEVLSTIQPVLRKGAWQVTAAIWDDGREPPRLLALWPGFREAAPLGMAVDLGSTTIAGHLVDLTDGRVLASSGLMNPQIRFGEDLMSRVSYSMLNEGGAEEMTAAVRDGLGRLSGALAEEAGVAREDIFEAVIVCNPVMHHLMLGLDPVELGQAPFAPATTDAMTLRASELGLGLHPAARTYVLPIIAGHVGADAAAVVLSEQPQQSEDLLLCVDVGTNAEIILGDRSRVLACSSPTGPAFEGAQISSGQRAAPGAIERVRIDPATKAPRFRVIGVEAWSDEPGFAEAVAAVGGVSGICGSGIIEAIAEMRIAGLVDPGGLIGSAEQTGAALIEPQGRTHAYLLHDGSAAGGPVIRVTQGDVRAIQLAKSALYAGARLLMDEFGAERVDRISLAGAFGAHISPLHALVLGMIPDCPPEKVVAVGNAAGTGARIALCSRAARREIEGAVRDITRVETAIAPRFQEHFVAANGIPNSADPFPALAAVVSLPDVSFNAESGRRRRR
ncbi:DUF4445 domain-containing protein [Paracoccus sp. S-4012]|uniref:ASKHA domain-containing protein n=1 Tax=Paracoccus sp. S-4012 TaxID=2665648 RepID=UPI0012B0D360|nr:ASKHA domain-containing protein [Paracoccus sp. S-4012]MRX50783.1 DUF4445 domain-containing protein [Paracoccus sp. S-4012]